MRKTSSRNCSRFVDSLASSSLITRVGGKGDVANNFPAEILKLVRFARHGTNEVCGVECKSAVFYGTELSNPQSSSIGELYRGNILEGISLPQAASRFSSRNLQIEKNQFTVCFKKKYLILNIVA